MAEIPVVGPAVKGTEAVGKGLFALVKAHPVAFLFVAVLLILVIVRFRGQLLNLIGMAPVVGPRAVAFGAGGSSAPATQAASSAAA